MISVVFCQCDLFSFFFQMHISFIFNTLCVIMSIIEHRIYFLFLHFKVNRNLSTWLRVPFRIIWPDIACTTFKCTFLYIIQSYFIFFTVHGARIRSFSYAWVDIYKVPIPWIVLPYILFEYYFCLFNLPILKFFNLIYVVSRARYISNVFCSTR